jgi:hypothetical protein
MILYFRDSNNSEFNHWVAFLGIKGNHVRIMDTPHELAHLTMAELLALWDGVAIILSEKPVHNVMLWQAKPDYFWCVLLVIGCGIFYKTYFWNETLELSITTIRRKYWWKLFSQIVSLLVVCGFVAITYHVLSPIGFLNNPSAVAEVTRRYHAVDVPEIAISELQQIVEQKSAVIYDTRYRQDFIQGAVPGAVSLPVLCLFFPLVGSYSHVFSPKRWGSPASLLTEILRRGHPDQDGKTRINVSQAEGICSAKKAGAPSYGRRFNDPENRTCRHFC